MITQCKSCGENIKFSPSRKRKFCSRKCMSLYFNGVNNPNYKGLDKLTICVCGGPKDYRSDSCANCAKTSTPIGSGRKIALTEEILQCIKGSSSVNEVARKLGRNKATISRIIKEHEIDIAHFKRRPQVPEKFSFFTIETLAIIKLLKR